MKIRKGSWYYKLYLKAYSEDRGWVEWFRGIDWSLLPDGIPGTEELAEWNRHAANTGYDDNDQSAHIWAALRHARTQFNEAYERTIVAQRQERAQKVRQQLESGMMSLCPFFWKVMAATLIYLVLFGTLRWMVNTFIVRPCTWIAGVFNAQLIRKCAFVGLAIAAIAGVGGAITYYPTWQRDRQAAAVEEARLKAKRLAYEEYWRVEAENRRNLREKYRLEQEQQWKLQAEESRKYKAEQAVEERRWEVEHPEEVAAKKAKAEALEKEQQFRFSISNINSKIYWNHVHVKDLERWFGVLIRFIYFLLGLEAFLFMVFVLRCVAPWFIRVLNRPLALIGHGLGMLFGGIFFVFVALRKSRGWQVVVRGYCALRWFLADTAHLVREFSKAKYRRVCPFLQVVDDDMGNSRA